MTTASSISTAAALFEAGDIGPCELIRGRLAMMTPAGAEHGAVANQIAFQLTRFVEEHHLGKVFAAETGFQIAWDPDTVRAPDVAFVGKAALGQRIVKGYWPGPPELAVEVMSPNDTAGSMQEKVQDWLHAGVQQVWVADPAPRTISVFRPSAPIAVFHESDELQPDDLLPGLRLSVDAVFS